MDTQCSTVHCHGRAKIEDIPRNGRWWEPVANPAPFCPSCIARAESNSPAKK